MQLKATPTSSRDFLRPQKSWCEAFYIHSDEHLGLFIMEMHILLFG